MFLYSIAIRLYGVAVGIASLWNQKAKKWIDGRKDWEMNLTAAAPSEPVFWMHCASLGEYQHARPVLMEIKRRDPSTPWILSFFSPSGYDNFTDHDLVDYVFYLPLDTVNNARALLGRISAKAVFFTKAELWPALWTQLKQADIPHYQFSASYHSKSSILSRALSRKCLQGLTLLCCQDDQSQSILASYDIAAVTTGNPRIDEVMRRKESAAYLTKIQNWSSNFELVIVAGSTWPDDMEIWSKWIHTIPPQIGFLFAPHDVGAASVLRQIDILNAKAIVRHTDQSDTIIEENAVYCLDTIGLLAAAYQYADIAYIGGGHRTGLHSTLEPAAYSLPLMIGPNYNTFPEAVAMVGLGTAKVVNSASELSNTISMLLDDDFREEISAKQMHYMNDHLGAARRTADHIWNTLRR